MIVVRPPGYVREIFDSTDLESLMHFAWYADACALCARRAGDDEAAEQLQAWADAARALFHRGCAEILDERVRTCLAAADFSRRTAQRATLEVQ